MKGSVFVGTSGWNYKHWANGRFYPQGLAQKHWLSFYAERFGTVEINNTFYRLPSPETFAGWAKSESLHHSHQEAQRPTKERATLFVPATATRQQTRTHTVSASAANESGPRPPRWPAPLAGEEERSQGGNRIAP